MNINDKIRLEILKGNQLEHDKIAHEMALTMEFDNPRKKKVENERNGIIRDIHTIVNKYKK